VTTKIRHALAGLWHYTTITEQQMSHAAAVQDNPATVPAKTIDQLIVEGSTELIQARSIAGINAVLERFDVDYRVPLDDVRLADAATALAKAIQGEQVLGEELAAAQWHLYCLRVRIDEHAPRKDAILAGHSLSTVEREFARIGDECDGLKKVIDDALESLAVLDTSAAAADVARCTTELSRAEHSILAQIMAGHVDRAEHALLSAVAALREVTRIGVKHLGPDVGEDYVPGAGMVALLARLIEVAEPRPCSGAAS
jgi:hypothetical protein